MLLILLLSMILSVASPSSDSDDRSKVYGLSVDGDLSGMVLRSEVDENGVISVIAIPQEKGHRVISVTHEGKAEVSQTEDPETFVRTITISGQESSVRLIFFGVSKVE